MASRVIKFCACASIAISTFGFEGCKSGDVQKPVNNEAAAPLTGDVDQKRENIKIPTSRESFSKMYKKGLTIGIGNSAIIHACTKVEDNKQYALKIFNERNSKKAENEVLVLLHLRETPPANVIYLVDAFNENGIVSFTMPLYAGSLQSKDPNTWTEGEVAKLAQDTLRIVHSLHQKGVAHMGICLSDMLVNADGTQLVLADFENAVMEVSEFERSYKEDVRAIAFLVDACLGSKATAGSRAFINSIVNSKGDPRAEDALNHSWLKKASTYIDMHGGGAPAAAEGSHARAPASRYD